MKEWMVRALVMAQLRPSNLRDVFFGESKTSPSRQEARGRSKITARFQKVWQGEVLELRLLQQHQHPDHMALGIA